MRCLPPVLVLSVAACERVTAPEALKVADRIEAEVAQGRFDNFHKLLMFGADVGPVPFGQRARGAPFVPVTQTASLFVERDGGTEPVNAFVIERVYVPYDDAGTPVRRRTLVVWPDSFEYSLVARTENGARSIDRNGFYPEMGSDHLHPASGVRLARPRDEDSWIGRSGSISIEPAGADSACPQFSTAPGAEPAERVDCHATTFSVRVDAELDRAGDTTLARLTGIPTVHRFRVVEQRVPGLRFTVHCAKLDFKTLDWSKVDINSPCNSHPEAFWRNDTLFAPRLGVHIADFTHIGPPGSSIIARTIERGQPAAPGTIPRGYLRWTAYMPNGKLVVSDSASIAHLSSRDAMPVDSLARTDPFNSLETLDPGGIREYLAPAWIYVPGSGQLGMVVVRVERSK